MKKLLLCLSLLGGMSFYSAHAVDSGFKLDPDNLPPAYVFDEWAELSSSLTDDMIGLFNTDAATAAYQNAEYIGKLLELEIAQNPHKRGELKEALGRHDRAVFSIIMEKGIKALSENPEFCALRQVETIRFGVNLIFPDATTLTPVESTILHVNNMTEILHSSMKEK